MTRSGDFIPIEKEFMDALWGTGGGSKQEDDDTWTPIVYHVAGDDLPISQVDTINITPIMPPEVDPDDNR